MRRLSVLLGLVAVLVSCSTKNRNNEQKFFDEVGALSKEQIMARGDKLAEKKKWEEARKYYSFLSDSFPNDPLGRRASLKVADTFYARNDTESLTEAQLRYKDFSNRFPNDPNRPYALLMLGKCSYQETKGPLRDLGPVREAEQSFRQVLELYPTSQYAAEAKTLLASCQEELARHEFEIGRFYARVGAWAGAKQRLEYLVTTYPLTQAAHEARALLAEVERKSGDGTEPKKNPASPEQATAPQNH